LVHRHSLGWVVAPLLLRGLRVHPGQGRPDHRRRQRAQAREPLAAGLELACRCGAERLLARAAEELRIAEARPRRIQRTGVDALTASELRTARLAAGGRSNAEVAQELFVSLKTVETHLSHAYAKLGLTGPGARRQLATALG
jgi:DNA-binding CsgD family transcriptional regulator